MSYIAQPVKTKSLFSLVIEYLFIIRILISVDFFSQIELKWNVTWNPKISNRLDPWYNEILNKCYL